MFILLLFVVLNIFLLVFYIQQVKFLQSSKKKFIFFKQNYTSNLVLVQFFIFMQFLNKFSIVLLPNIFLIISHSILCIIKWLLINVWYLDQKKNKNHLLEC